MTTIIDLFYIVSDMFDDDSNLSPDLVWMLQSDQIDVDALIEALVSSFYQQIFLNAISRLNYSEEAHRAAQETLIQAISQKRDFRGETSVAEWLETIASGIFVERKLNQENLQFLNPKLINSIRARQPGNTLSDRQLQRAIQEIKLQLHAQNITRSKWASLQLLGITGIGILLVYFMFTFSSAMLAGTPVDYTPASQHNLLIEATETIISIPDLEHPSPTEGAGERSIKADSLPPLTTKSSTEEIKDRIHSSSQLWNTMWADIVVNFYGSAGYVGPPHSERHQFWLDQNRGGLLVSGPLDGFPDYIEKIILFPETSPPRLGLLGTTGYTKLGSHYPWFSIKTETIFLFPFAINYLFNTFDQDLLKHAEFSVIGEEIIAGREAVIVELSTPDGKRIARLWLEELRGIVLREQYFDPIAIGKVVIESSLKKIDFDGSIPTMWKRPEKSIIVSREDLLEISGSSDQPSSDKLDYPMMGFPFRSPPSNFDLSQSRISFVKTNRTDLGSEETGEFHIFVDNYFLGDIEMINPLKVICDRSPDGTKLVFSEWRVFPTDVNNKIYLLDLHEVNLVSLDIPDTIIFWVSFSPDNRSVIITGYDGLDGQNKFYLIDFTTGDYELLPIQTGFGSVAWSPDGTKIAVLDLSIFPSELNTSTRIRIFDIQTGDEKRKFISKEIPRGAPNLEVLLDGWTAEFHTQLQDISHCAASP